MLPKDGAADKDGAAGKDIGYRKFFKEGVRTKTWTLNETGKYSCVFERRMNVVELYIKYNNGETVMKSKNKGTMRKSTS